MLYLIRRALLLQYLENVGAQGGIADAEESLQGQERPHADWFGIAGPQASQRLQQAACGLRQA